jgi:hypothetical protein
MAKAIAPAAVVAVKEALNNLYWYKSDLRSFLASTISPGLLARLRANVSRSANDPVMRVRL